MFGSEIIPVLDHLFPKIEEEMLTNSFYEDSTTFIPKPDENIIRKESCRSIFFISI